MFETIKTGPWAAAQPGQMAHRVVLSKRTTQNEWCTHMECKHEDGSLSKTSGHYFPTLWLAWDDFDRRVI